MMWEIDYYLCKQDILMIFISIHNLPKWMKNMYKQKQKKHTHKHNFMNKNQFYLLCSENYF